MHHVLTIPFRRKIPLPCEAKEGEMGIEGKDDIENEESLSTILSSSDGQH